MRIYTHTHKHTCTQPCAHSGPDSDTHHKYKHRRARVQTLTLIGARTDTDMHTHACHTQAPTDTLTDPYRSSHPRVARSARPRGQEEELRIPAAAATSFLLEPPGQQRAPEVPSLQDQPPREGEHVVATLPPKPGPLCSPAPEEATAPGDRLATESSGPCLVSLLLALETSWGAVGHSTGMAATTRRESSPIIQAQ